MKSKQVISDDRKDIIELVEQALHRLKNNYGNANGGAWQAGGAYWRLCKAVEWIDSQLEAIEGKEHSEFLRQNHEKRLIPKNIGDE